MIPLSGVSVLHAPPALVLGFLPMPHSMRNRFLLFANYPAYGILLHSLNGPGQQALLKHLEQYLPRCK